MKANAQQQRESPRSGCADARHTLANAPAESVVSAKLEVGGFSNRHVPRANTSFSHDSTGCQRVDQYRLRERRSKRGSGVVFQRSLDEWTDVGCDCRVIFGTIQKRTQVDQIDHAAQSLPVFRQHASGCAVALNKA
jgi:hypothetical protein